MSDVHVINVTEQVSEVNVVSLAGAADPLFNVDHGQLTGLGDDDHTQYAKADGSRGAFLKSAAAATTSTDSGGVVVSNDGSGNITVAHQAKPSSGISTTVRVDSIAIDTFGHVTEITGATDVAAQRTALGLGSAALSNSTDFATAAQGAAAANAIQSVQADSSPQLGGDLDTNNSRIKSVSNNDITLATGGTGSIVVGSDSGSVAGSVKVLDSSGSKSVKIAAPVTITGSSYTATLPAVGPQEGDSLVATLSDGTLAWQSPAAIGFFGLNKTGGTISKGTPVRTDGVLGASVKIAAAVNNSASTMPCVGIAAEDIANDQSGKVVQAGILGAINTASFSVGDDLFVQGTLAPLSSTRQGGESNLVQKIGQVLVSNASTGKILVLPSSPELMPNLDQDKLFVGNSTGVPTSTAMSAINLTKFNNDIALEDSYVGQIESVSNKTYHLDPRVAKARTITAIFADCTSGTCTATFKNGTTTVAAVSVSSTESTTTGSSLSNITLPENGSLTMVVSSNSSCVDFRFAVEYTQ